MNHMCDLWSLHVVELNAHNIIKRSSLYLLYGKIYLSYYFSYFLCTAPSYREISAHSFEHFRGKLGKWVRRQQNRSEGKGTAGCVER